MSCNLAPHQQQPGSTSAATQATASLPPTLDEDMAVSLPDELWLNICRHLSPTHLSRLLLSSRTLYALRTERELQPALEASKLLRYYGAEGHGIHHGALYAAIDYGNRNKQPVALVRALLKEPKVMEAATLLPHTDKSTCLLLACMRGLHDIASLLLDVPGVVVNQQAEGSQVTALHVLCGAWTRAYRSTDNLQRLLQLPTVDVNAVGVHPHHFHSTSTALHVACCIGYVEAVALLLAHPCINVNSTDPSGIMPLYSACTLGKTECVQLLLQHPDVNVRGSHGAQNISAKEAALRGGHHSIAELMTVAERRIGHDNLED